MYYFRTLYHLILYFAVHPIIEPVSNFSAFVGSEVILICVIINWGVPKAIIRWMRGGRYVPEDLITANDTHTALRLFNLTQHDNGVYSCIADSPLSPIGNQVYLYLQGNIAVYKQKVFF